MNQVTTGTSASEYDAWLASACMPPGLVLQLLDAFHDPQAVYTAFEQGDRSIRTKIPQRFADLLKKNGCEQNLRHLRELMDKHSVGVLRMNDPMYPDELKKIREAPVILFWQGDIHCLQNRMLAMVGSRAASYSGQRAARKLASDLSRQGISIVSGLACGIDASSHQGCIDGGTPTVAVTASGPDIVYPKENIRLRNEILEKGGLILTEYAPGEKPAGWHFPYRNRIIAGLVRALILVEAKIRSGSMTSVQHALDQGKDVFVYPGEPDSACFEGNHQLLREGGIYFTCAGDILSDLDWLDNQSAVRHNSDCSATVTADTPEQAEVIRALKPGKLGFEQLLELTGMDPPSLMSTLTILQISGRIEALPGKQYQLRYQSNPEG